MLNLKTIFFLLISIGLTAQSYNRKISPISSKWSFKEVGSDKSYPASVPGTVQTDLLANDLTPDPFSNDTETELQWIEEKDWEYTTQLKISDSQLSYQHLELVFKGLDTYADVFLNGEFLLSANNMFRKWSVDIKPWCKSGANELKIVFRSPIHENKKKVSNYPFKLPSGNETVDTKVSAFTRKATYQFGWDWSPRFVTAGIWKPIYIEAWNEVRIIDAYCETLEIKKDTALIHLEVVIESKAAKGHYELEYFEKREKVELQAGENRLHFTFKVAHPKLWWPNGMGEPYLYSFPLKLKEGLQTVDAKKLQLGIRTVELVQEKDSIGTPFYFKVNGETVFIKGANYVPQDAFLNRVEDSDYEGIIAKAKEAHFNMLRIWGGGIYEKDLLYELCDVHGILVWQDFMFANSLYPSNTDFQLNLATEVKENIIRLRKHPSIALWCGNNEIEVAWGNWGWQDQYGYNAIDSAVIWNQQLQVFQHLIPDILKQYYPTANYTSTTPLSNWGTAENFNHSSMHYWGVWHGKEPFENFKTNVGRFMVEYGFQSFPDYSLLQKSINKDQLHLQSEVMKKRQKSYIGNGMITKHSEKWFGKAKNFKDYVIKSQQTQAVAMQIAITQHRLQQPHCMGTLFWQFNDCWPGPSWSVLNYDQSEKLAYQTVKTWYAPVIAIPSKIDGEIVFYITSDKRKAQNLKLMLKIKGTNITKYQSSDLLIKKGETFLLRTGLKPEGEFELRIKLEDQGKTIWSTNVPSYLLF